MPPSRRQGHNQRVSPYPVGGRARLSEAQAVQAGQEEPEVSSPDPYEQVYAIRCTLKRQFLGAINMQFRPVEMVVVFYRVFQVWETIKQLSINIANLSPTIFLAIPLDNII